MIVITLNRQILVLKQCWELFLQVMQLLQDAFRAVIQRYQLQMRMSGSPQALLPTFLNT